MHITRSAPAKVNLSLLVGPNGPSGYHELFTVFAPIDVFDVLSFALEAKPASSGPGELHVKAHAIEAEANIVAHALHALERHTGWVFTGRVTIDKGIPLAAGMGGGSTDAATALQVGAQLIGEAGGPAPSRDELHLLARVLGADVPFFLDPRPAIGRGIGDLLQPLPLPELPILLVFTDQPLSTARVYREFDIQNSAEDPAAFRRPFRGGRGAWRQAQTVKDVVGSAPQRLGGDELQPATRTVRRQRHSPAGRGARRSHERLRAYDLRRLLLPGRRSRPVPKGVRWTASTAGSRGP